MSPPQGEKGKWLFAGLEEWAWRRGGILGFPIIQKGSDGEAGSRNSFNSHLPEAGMRGAPTVCPAPTMCLCYVMCERQETRGALVCC